MSQNSINFLPEEMIIKIFHLLSPIDLKNVMLVCKQWMEIGEDPSFWTWAQVTIETREEIQKLNIRRLQRVEKVRVTRYDFYWKLDLRVHSYWKAEELAELFLVLLEFPSVTKIIGLQYINLSGVDSNLLADVFNKLSEFPILCGHGENVFAAVAKQTNLKKLYVYGSHNIRPSLFADSISNVEDVYLIDFRAFSNHQIKPEQLEALFVSITEENRPMRNLYLSSCETDDIMPELFGAALNMLESVVTDDHMFVTKEQITAVISKVVDGESKLQRLMFKDLDHDEVIGLDPVLVRRAREKIGVFFSEAEFLE